MFNDEMQAKPEYLGICQEELKLLEDPRRII